MTTDIEGIVEAIEAAREELLAYEPPWLEPRYEAMRSNVDTRLRSAELAIAVLKRESESAP